jgi:hypothetical protein
MQEQVKSHRVALVTSELRRLHKVPLLVLALLVEVGDCVAVDCDRKIRDWVRKAEINLGGERCKGFESKHIPCMRGAARPSIAKAHSEMQMVSESVWTTPAASCRGITACTVWWKASAAPAAWNSSRVCTFCVLSKRAHLPSVRKARRRGGACSGPCAAHVGGASLSADSPGLAPRVRLWSGLGLDRQRGCARRDRCTLGRLAKEAVARKRDGCTARTGTRVRLARAGLLREEG